jgi:hypothetical protein
VTSATAALRGNKGQHSHAAAMGGRHRLRQSLNVEIGVDPRDPPARVLRSAVVEPLIQAQDKRQSFRRNSSDGLGLIATERRSQAARDLEK